MRQFYRRALLSLFKLRKHLNWFIWKYLYLGNPQQVVALCLPCFLCCVRRPRLLDIMLKQKCFQSRHQQFTNRGCQHKSSDTVINAQPSELSKAWMHNKRPLVSAQSCHDVWALMSGMTRVSTLRRVKVKFVTHRTDGRPQCAVLITSTLLFLCVRFQTSKCWEVSENGENLAKACELKKRLCFGIWRQSHLSLLSQVG